MERIDLNSWSDFPSALKNIQDKFAIHKHKNFVEKNVILYRGQADSNWRLKTTLERFSRKSWSVRKYAHLLRRCSPELETFTNQNFKLPSYEDLNKELTSKYDDTNVYTPFYHFWVYLRHRGFPSPLLDWTESPHIAVFFCFRRTIRC